MTHTCIDTRSATRAVSSSHARRPSGPRYRWLLERFEMAVGRNQIQSPARNLVLSSLPLSDSDRQTLRRRAAEGVFVSDHLAVDPADYVPALAADRLSNSMHVELLGSLLTPSRPACPGTPSRLRVDRAPALKRLYRRRRLRDATFRGAAVPDSRNLRNPGRSHARLRRFHDPHTGDFDLVIANHMFTHAVRPRAFSAQSDSAFVRAVTCAAQREPDERSYLEDGKSIFRSLNPFHLRRSIWLPPRGRYARRVLM